jgi:UDP-N-acetylglucosamine 2-epimerase (non-hydrolysing)
MDRQVGRHLRVMLVAGARPNFMKIAPVIEALRGRGHAIVLVHTGQHYDDRMSDAFFTDLGLPRPDYHLGVGSASHAVQTARIMTAFEPVLLDERPDWVLVPGDVNSTVAAALVAVKLKESLGCRLAHLEAGLRSHDWRMPEEVNRVLTDRMSDLLLTPSRDAGRNLDREGIEESRVAFVGNVMIDSLLARLPAAQARDLPGELGLPRYGYVAATLHRPSNVDTAETLSVCLTAFAEIARRLPLVLPVHPRTRQQVERFGLGELLARVRAVEPLGYLEMMSLTEGAAAVLTDSGGLQEETTALGVPCVTLREQTERPITITEGTNRLAPWPLSVEGILQAMDEALELGRARGAPRRPEGWDGRSAERVVLALERATDGAGGATPPGMIEGHNEAASSAV